MISFLLILIAVCSFVFYGVVGQDKTWLLAPAYLVVFTAVSIAMVKRSLRVSRSDAKFAAVPPSFFTWIIFLLWSVAMIPAAVVPFESKLVTLFVGAVIGAYFVWGSELRAFKDNRILLGGLIFVVMLVALYGMVVHFKCPNQVLWTERFAVYEGRLMSTYICPNHFAHLMQMLFPFCLALLFIPQAGMYLKILSAYSFVVFIPPLFLTESRAGWLGAIAAIGTFVCLMAWRKSKKLFFLLVILVPLFAMMLLFAGWRYSETFQRRAKPVVSFLQQQSEEGVGSAAKDFRPQTWMDTIDMIKESPLLGFGPGNYRYAYPEHRERFRGQSIVTGHPHNEYLELIADYGLIGFGLFLLAWIYGCLWILIKGLRAKESRHAFMAFAFSGAAAGTMVHSFFDFQMHVFPNALTFAFLAAISVGPLMEKKTNDRTSRGGFVIFISWALALSFVLLTLFSARVMSSSFIRALGDKAAAAQESEKAADRYHLAIQIDESNWRAYSGMASLLSHDRRYALDLEEKTQRAVEEREWFERALIHNSKEPLLVSGLGRTLLFLSRREADKEKRALLEERGLERLTEACAYRKFNDHHWWILGVELRKTERYQDALEAFRKMETIKQTASSRKNIQWLQRRIKEESGTVEEVEVPVAPRAVVELDPNLKPERMGLSELLDSMSD